MDVDAQLALALELADLADAITVGRFRARDLVVETKPDLTPVSEADHAVERAVREHLAKVARTHSVLGEEFGDDGGDARFRWIVDPIDGTKNYVRGVPVWATLLALEVDRELVVGVVSAPALHTRWWGARGLGAFRDGESVHVSAVSDLADAQVSFAWDTSDRFLADGIGDRMLSLAHQCWRTRGLGDFWQHMLVAEGAFDIGIDPVVSLWDVAALVPVLEEAGGRWTTIEGTIDIDGGSFVCTNSRLHDQVLEALRSPGA